MTSEVSRWQFFQDNDIDENNLFGWSNLPPCKAKNRVVIGSFNKRNVCKLNSNFMSYYNNSWNIVNYAKKSKW